MNQDPPAELVIDKNLLKNLISSQFPELSELELSFVDEGWDNVNYKLGSQYLIRLPRRQVGAELIKNEIKFLKRLGPKLPIAIPVPQFIGNADKEYPWKWTISPWFEGETADLSKLGDEESQSLAYFLKVLHGIKMEDPPSNPHRSCPLSEKVEALSPRIERLKRATNFFNSSIERLWNLALEEDLQELKCLIHGDLHSRNIVVENEKLKAIIDWGDVCLGDPATDLASLWMLFENNTVRNKALAIYGADTSLIKRSIGWAIYFAIVLLDTGMNSNPRHARMGERIFENLANEPRI